MLIVVNFQVRYFGLCSVMYVLACCNTYRLIPDWFTRINAICVFKNLTFQVCWADPAWSRGEYFLSWPWKGDSSYHWWSTNILKFLSTDRRMCSCFILQWLSTCRTIDHIWIVVSIIIQCFECPLHSRTLSRRNTLYYWWMGSPHFFWCRRVWDFMFTSSTMNKWH